VREGKGSGLRPIDGALDRCVIVDKHRAILLDSTSFVNVIALVGNVLDLVSVKGKGYLKKVSP